MNAIEIINRIVVVVGLPTIIAAVLVMGRKLQILDSLNETAKTIKHNMTVISFFLTKHNKEFNSSELQAFSPLQLTDDGRRFIKAIGFDNVFIANKKAFLDFINNESPRLKYDVEISAIKSIVALSNEPFMEFLKIYFYNNPKRSLDNLSPTLGIYIRDLYLADHPEITQ